MKNTTQQLLERKWTGPIDYNGKFQLFVCISYVPLISFVIISLFHIIFLVLFTQKNTKNRGSYMSAHVLLNLLNQLRKRDKMRGFLSILSFFRNEFNKFNNTRARVLDSIYHMTLILL